MALTIDAGVLEQQERKAKPSRFRILYRRRFWNIETQTYDLEASQTEVLKSDVHRVGASREALDRKGINQFESSNITIELHNNGNIWNPLNPAGLFNADSVARLGYEPQLMEFSVELIYELEDGTEATAIPVFTEGRASKFINRPDDDIVVITVESKAILLKRADAEEVSDSHPNTGLIGVVDAVNTTFTSPDTGVGRVDEVREGGATRTLGSQVVISNLNDPSLPATFEFSVAPVVQPFADYLTWKKDQPIETLVELLAVVAGIPLIDQEVTPVTYPTQVLNKEIITTQADWQAGLTITDIDTETNAGEIRSETLDLIDDFSDGDFTSNPTWTVTSGAWGVFSLAGKKYLGSNSPGSLTLNQIEVLLPAVGPNKGTWEFTHRYRNFGQTNAIPINAGFLDGFDFRFMFDQASAHYYDFAGSPDGGGINPSHTFRIRRVNPGSTTLGSFVLGGGVYADSVDYVWRITRDSVGGDIKVYLDGVLKLTVNDLGVNVADKILVRGDSADALGNRSRNFFTNIRKSPNIFPAGTDLVAPTAIWESDGIDTGAGNPASYGLLDHIDSIPAGGSILYETATSDDDITYDPFVAIGGTNLILSTVRRFIKVKSTLTTTTPSIPTPPSVQEIAVNFITTTTDIALANFTRLTVFQAIALLAQIANFEWGLSREGKLFFRPRTFKTSADHTVILADLQSFTRIEDGVDRIFNLIRASYGNHEKIASPTLRGDPSPNSFDRFGVKSLAVGSTQILLDPDADIATGLSLSYFQEFKNPRRIFEVEIDLRPQMELADAILLRVLDFLPDPPWHIGDTSRAIGDTDIHLFGAEQQAACEILARILSVRHNVITMKTSLELEEII